MQINITSLEEIHLAAKTFVSQLADKRVFAFYGEMGVGKTTFIKAICAEMGVTDVMNSPTFAIVNEYLGAKDEQIFHFDFYRINSVEEVYDFGYEDYFYSGAYCFIEWPEKIDGLLPQNTVKVVIAEQDDKSRIINII